MRRVPVLSWIRFCAKRTLVPALRKRASVRRGSLPVAAVLWSTVTMLNLDQGHAREFALRDESTGLVHQHPAAVVAQAAPVHVGRFERDAARGVHSGTFFASVGV